MKEDQNSLPLPATTNVLFTNDEGRRGRTEKLRRGELIPLGSRIRTRLATEHASREELIAGLAHLLAGAGNASLMTPQLRHTLCDHAAGNYS